MEESGSGEDGKDGMGNYFVSLEKIKTALAGNRNKFPFHSMGIVKGIPSAVILLLYPGEDSGLNLMLTLRSDSVESHKNQVSFPGGTWEKDKDDTLLDTALRETKEEVGVEPSLIQFIGALPRIFTVTGYTIFPFAGYISKLPELTVSHEEIAEVFSIPLNAFKLGLHFRKTEFIYNDRNHEIFFFEYDSKVVWGATAKIIKQFLDLIFPGFSAEIKELDSSERKNLDEWIRKGGYPTHRDQGKLSN